MVKNKPINDIIAKNVSKLNIDILQIDGKIV